MSKLIQCGLLCAFLVSAGSTPKSYAQEQAADSLAISPARLDSIKALRKKYRSKKTWEKFVAAPGWIVSLPLVLFFKSQEVLVGYAYENKLVPKARDLLVSEDGRRHLVPKYSNRHGLGLKLVQEGVLSPEDDLSLTVTGNLRGRQRYRLRLRDVRFFRNVFSTGALASYRYLSDEDFFGIGNDTRKGDKTIYDQEVTNLEARIGIHFNSQSLFGVLLGFDYNNIYGADSKEAPSVTDFYSKETLSGLHSQIPIASANVFLKIDSRNSRGYPTSGMELALGAGVFRDVKTDQYDFWKTKVDFRRYLQFFNRRTMMVRLAAEVTRPYSGREIPFFYLSSLGEASTIRGYNRYRFRDRDMVLAALEYRIPLWRPTSFTIFVDAGQVAEDIFREFNFNRMHWGYGFGMRLWSIKRLISTLEVAFSKDRIRVYFRLF